MLLRSTTASSCCCCFCSSFSDPPMGNPIVKTLIWSGTGVLGMPGYYSSCSINPALKTTLKLSEASDPSSNDFGFVDIDMETNTQELGSHCNGSGPAVVDSNGSEIELELQASSTQKAFNEPTLESLGLKKPELHSLILDFTPVNFVDTVCIKILKNIFRDFREIEVDVFLVGCHASVIDQLEKGNFFSQTITKHHLFASVHNAITYVTRGKGQNMPQPVTTYSSTKL
ncbi:unnamed protein product [Eretmochelys imbricata]